MPGLGLCKTHPPKHDRPKPGDKLLPVKDSPAAVVKRVRGNRVTERDGDHHPDGKGIAPTQSMRRTNRRLIAWGMNPSEGNPAWVL